MSVRHWNILSSHIPVTDGKGKNGIEVSIAGAHLDRETVDRITASFDPLHVKTISEGGVEYQPHTFSLMVSQEGFLRHVQGWEYEFEGENVSPYEYIFRYGISSPLTPSNRGYRAPVRYEKEQGKWLYVFGHEIKLMSPTFLSSCPVCRAFPA
jgi:hypothetical protein